MKVILAKGSDKLLGATVVSKHAGELIFPAVEMLQKGRGLKSLFGLILPYPTRMEIWNRAALTWRTYRFAESSFTQGLVRFLTGFEKNDPLKPNSASPQLPKCGVVLRCCRVGTGKLANLGNHNPSPWPAKTIRVPCG